MGYWGVASGVIGEGAVGSFEVADGSSVAIDLCDGQSTGAKIASGTIAGDNIASYAVSSYHLQSGSVCSGHVNTAYSWSWPVNQYVESMYKLVVCSGATLCVGGVVSIMGSGYFYLCSGAYGYFHGNSYFYGDVCFSGHMTLPGTSSGGYNGELRWCSNNYKVEVYCNGSWYALH